MQSLTQFGRLTRIRSFASALVFLVTTSIAIGSSFAQNDDLKVLFLGGADGSHRPRARFNEFEPVMRERGIALTYTDEMSDVNAENLAKYAALVVYANIDRIEPAEEKALLDYVAGGGGFVPLHCASYCFRNSPDVVALIGAQFQRHGWETVKDTSGRSRSPHQQGLRRLRKPGRDLRPSKAQRKRPHRARLSRGR